MSNGKITQQLSTLIAACECRFEANVLSTLYPDDHVYHLNVSQGDNTTRLSRLNDVSQDTGHSGAGVDPSYSHDYGHI
jgi:hypothetical protein